MNVHVHQPDDSPWLDTEQMSAWRGFMNIAQRLPAALDAQLQRDHQLSFLEYYALALLSESHRRLRLSDLATAVNAELSRVSHLVSRLEKRGLVRREPDPHDGRFTVGVLTDEGYDVVRAAAPSHVAAVRELFVEPLSAAELRTLTRVAGKMVDRIGAQPRRPAQRGEASTTGPV